MLCEAVVCEASVFMDIAEVNLRNPSMRCAWTMQCQRAYDVDPCTKEVPLSTIKGVVLGGAITNDEPVTAPIVVDTLGPIATSYGAHIESPAATAKGNSDFCIVICVRSVRGAGSGGGNRGVQSMLGRDS